MRVGGGLIKYQSQGSPTITAPQLTFYGDYNANTDRSMTMYATAGAGVGGTLHGTWVSEGTVTSSDRRLKYNILPLYKSILGQHKEQTMGLRAGLEKQQE